MKGAELKRLIELYEQGKISWKDWSDAIKVDKAIYDWARKNRGTTKLKILEEIGGRESLFNVDSLSLIIDKERMHKRNQRWLLLLITTCISAVIAWGVWFWLNERMTDTSTNHHSHAIEHNLKR